VSDRSDDILAIQRLMHLYAHRFDAGDIAGFADLFARGTLDFGRLAPAATGAQAVYEMIDRLVIMYDGSPRTNHVMSNVVIDIDEDRRGASAGCYVQILQATDGFPLQIIATGIYSDRFVNDDGDWRFDVRRSASSLVGDVSHHVRLRPPKA
jgi:hypothetical protein